MIEINGVEVPTENIMAILPALGGRAVQVRWLEGGKRKSVMVVDCTVSEITMRINRAKREGRPDNAGD